MASDNAEKHDQTGKSAEKGPALHPWATTAATKRNKHHATKFADIPRDVRLLDKAVWVACNLFTVPGLDLPSPAVMETMMIVLSRHTYLLLALNAKLRRFGVDNLVDLSRQDPKFRAFAQLERYSRFNEMPADLDRARAEVLDDHMRRLMAIRRRSDVAAGRAIPVVQPDVPMRRH
ncbi:Hypothetical predicted protein [Cloeon dipterum]|uniref:Uncharacterized protein n=1 Tax=Cloeon dipterum TaxID=197152 RepID=A0A8S1DBP0_9INSE|nr:Hypothetical predicted protein [Cloeon dipterum]